MNSSRLSLGLLVDDSSMRHWYRQFSAADFVGTLLNVSCRLQKNIHKKAWAKWWVSKKCSFAPTGRYIFRLLDAKCKTYKATLVLLDYINILNIIIVDRNIFKAFFGRMSKPLHQCTLHNHNHFHFQLNKKSAHLLCSLRTSFTIWFHWTVGGFLSFPVILKTQPFSKASFWRILTMLLTSSIPEWCLPTRGMSKVSRMWTMLRGKYPMQLCQDRRKSRFCACKNLHSFFSSDSCSLYLQEDSSHQQKSAWNTSLPTHIRNAH